MHWIVQNNLYNEDGYTKLMETLNRYGIKHTVVKVVPFSHELIPEPIIEPKDLVYVCGSTTLARIAKERNWNPGSYSNNNFRFEEWKKHWGVELLNYGAMVSTFKDAKPLEGWVAFFIRPCEDTKTFSGVVMSDIELEEWKERVMALKGEYSTLTEDTMVMVSHWKEIFSEYRFFVVNKKLVAWSQYKLGSRVVYNENVDDYIKEYAQKRVDEWQPDVAFCLDIADTPEGPKVLEINCINSAGFYAANVSKIVEAIEEQEQT